MPRRRADHDAIAAIDQTKSAPLHACIACGRLIRWALSSCFGCNKLLVDEAHGCFLTFK